MQHPATMVILMSLSSAVNRRAAFNFFKTVSPALGNIRLPPNSIAPDLFMTRGNGSLKKPAIKQAAQNFAPGTIVSLSDSGATRGVTGAGLRIHHCGGFLKNNLSIGITIQRGDKIVLMNAMVSSRMVHTCGVKTEAEAKMICGFILDAVRDLNERLVYFGKIPEHIRTATLKLTEAFRGPAAQRYYQELVVITIAITDWVVANEGEEGRTGRSDISVNVEHNYCKHMSLQRTVKLISIKWLMQQPDVDVKRKRNKFIRISYERPMVEHEARTHCNILLPSVDILNARGIDLTLFQTMERPHADFDSWQGWYQCCVMLMQTTFCHQDNAPQISNIRSSLVNCKLDLPFKPRLTEIARYFQDEGMVVKYDNQEDGYVSIYFDYVADDTICRKRKDGDAVEIMVFSSGKTNISGPSIAINQTACDDFVRLAFAYKAAMGTKIPRVGPQL